MILLQRAQPRIWAAYCPHRRWSDCRCWSWGRPYAAEVIYFRFRSESFPCSCIGRGTRRVSSKVGWSGGLLYEAHRLRDPRSFEYPWSISRVFCTRERTPACYSLSPWAALRRDCVLHDEVATPPSCIYWRRVPKGDVDLTRTHCETHSGDVVKAALLEELRYADLVLLQPWNCSGEHCR